MKRLIEMKLNFLKLDQGVDLEHLPNILMFSNRVILLPSSWVADDLPDRVEIRYTTNHLIKTIKNDLLPRMTEHPINDIEKTEDLLITRVNLEHKLQLRLAIEDLSSRHIFEMITRLLDPGLWNLRKGSMTSSSTRLFLLLVRRMLCL
jgi:hypothetical protein